MQLQIAPQTKILIACLFSVVLLIRPVNASDVNAVITSDSSKLVVDCENITTDEAQSKGSKIGDFIRAEEVGCEKSISTVIIPTKTETRIVMAGAFLMGTTGSNHFGASSRTRYSAKDVVVTGVPKVVAVNSNTGIGADFRITSIKTRYSTMSTEEEGTYTFGIYGYIASMVPTDGGVGYSDIQSIELNWAGVKVSGSYGTTNETTGETTWIPFTFDGNGTSTIDGADIKFTTRTNTSSDHCQKTASDDYECSYSEGYKEILKLANVSDVNEAVSCPAVRDFIEENPDLADKFVCKKGGVVIDCKTVEDAKLVCKNQAGATVDCNEVYEKNACYSSGKTADEYGYSCYYGTEKVSCKDAGYGDGCPSLCKLNGAEVSCEDVVNLNACEQYNIFPDSMGYTCELYGEMVPCSTFGKGACAEKAVCNYGSDSILCSRYENTLACAEKYDFSPSSNYWCQIGNVRVDCSTMTPAQSCNLAPLVCKNTTTGKVIPCSEVADYNACASYGQTALSRPEFVCTFDDVIVPCSIVEPTSSSSCPLPKECRLKEGNAYTDCSNMENANQCAKEGYGEYLQYYSCSKGTSSFDCAKDMNEGSCDLSICASACDYQGVSLDGTSSTCVCIPAPVCSGPVEDQTGSNACIYGGIAQGGGTRGCVCNAEPDCSTLCEWKGKPKGSGEEGCQCNVQLDCYNTMICAFGGVNKDDGSCECDETPAPSCSGQSQYQYYGATKINVKTEADGYCKFGGICSGQENDDRFLCNANNCPFGATYADATKNTTGSDVCPYGHDESAVVYYCKDICTFGHTGTSTVNKSSDCQCLAQPVCSGNISAQTGSNKCTYGGTPAADGTAACTCISEPECASTCAYGGTPKANGTAECVCNEKKNCSDPSICKYSGSNRSDGTCQCFGAPTCTGTIQTGSNYCTNGGTPAGEGSRACICY